MTAAGLRLHMAAVRFRTVKAFILTHSCPAARLTSLILTLNAAWLLLQHGHVENDESWHPTVKSNYEKLDKWAKLGRLLFPFPLFAYPFYLLNRSPGKNGSHYDPKSDLFTASEGPLVETSNKFQCAWIGFLAGCTVALGPLAMLNLYVLPCEFGVAGLLVSRVPAAAVHGSWRLVHTAAAKPL